MPSRRGPHKRWRDLACKGQKGVGVDKVSGTVIIQSVSGLNSDSSGKTRNCVEVVAVNEVVCDNVYLVFLS